MEKSDNNKIKKLTWLDLAKIKKIFDETPLEKRDLYTEDSFIEIYNSTLTKSPSPSPNQD